MDISGLIPYLIAAAGIIWGIISGAGKKKAQSKQKIAEYRADLESERADIAVKTTDYIIKSEKIADEKVKEAVNIAKTTRGRFTSQPTR